MPLLSTFSSGSIRDFGTFKASGGGGGVAAAVVPTTNLYSHWDFSKLTEAVNTTFTSSGSGVSGGQSGLSWGASSLTPSLTYTAAGATTYPMVIKQTATGKKYISFTTTNGAAGNGSGLIGGPGGFPDITSAGYSWFAVYRWTSTPPGYCRAYRWWLGGYSYDFNHATLWDNAAASSGEFNLLTYSGGQSFLSDPITPATKGVITTTNIYAVFVSVTGTSFSSYYVNPNGVFTGTSGTAPAVTYSSQPASNRYLNIRDNNYSVSAGSMDMMEIGFYSAPTSSASMISTLSALYTKWTT